MKLAEALLLRADLQKKVISLKKRIGENAKVQEGDTPSENPVELLSLIDVTISELYALIEKIHMTNAVTILPNGKKMMTVLTQRDELAERHRIIQHVIDSARTETERYSHREIKWQKTVDVSALQKQADDIAGQLRQINAELQATNWQVELVS